MLTWFQFFAVGACLVVLIVALVLKGSVKASLNFFGGGLTFEASEKKK